MKTKSAFIALVALLLLVAPGVCRAQWTTQRIPLVPGWNAVYLEVQPDPRTCSAIFTNLPVQKVWKWDRRFSTIQFTADPGTPLAEPPDWLMWLPASDPRAFLSRMSELQGGQAYLIQVATNAAPFTLALKGRVIVPHLTWLAHGLNLVGLPVNSNSPPYFSDFFRFTPEVITTASYANELYKLDSQGRGLRIVQPARERIQPGVAYWVACARAPAYQSALQVTPQGAGNLDFGLLLAKQDLTIKNTLTNLSQTVWLKQQASETPPASGGFAELAGPVPLSYQVKNSSNQWVWAAFPSGGLSQTLAPGAVWTVHLGVRRTDFAAYVPQGTNGAAYQSILEVTDAGQSLRLRVPVLAQKDSLVKKAMAVSKNALDSSLDQQDPNEGLWLGQVTVNQVNAPAYTGSGLLPAPAPLSFRLLVHVDAYSTARLLQQVVLAWDSTLIDSTHTNGAYALNVDDSTVPLGASNVNRICSTAFPPMAPVALSGSLGSSLAGEVVVGFNDPCNPFLHRYHPMHDNLDANYQPYTNGVETRTIVRAINLNFNAATNASADPFYGVDNASGVYQETLNGLRAQPIVMQGVFSLQRISRINQLQGITP